MFPSAFETLRLVARLPVLSDSEQLFAAYASLPEASRYLMWRPHTDVAATRSFVSGCIDAAAAGTRFAYVLALGQAANVPIGMIEARPSDHSVDLGYVLAPAHWGHGFMPEAIAGLSGLALAQPRVFRVQAFCDVENLRSQRALEKAGFLREGRHERFAVHPNLGAEPRPCFMYAVSRQTDGRVVR